MPSHTQLFAPSRWRTLLGRVWAGVAPRNDVPATAWVEEYEPRVLYSADLAPHALLLSNGPQVVEQRVLDARGEFAADAATAAQAREVVIVDGAVDNKNILINQILINSDREVDIVTLDAAQDGVSQVTAALAGRSDIAAVHIISHGADGEVQLGNGKLDAVQLAARHDEIAQWAKSLTADANILLYGCDVAADARGQAFVQQLSAVTGADVAASTNLTGSNDRGGDWRLEFVSGTIANTPLVFDGAPLAWSGVLATFSVTNTSGANASGSLLRAISDANATAGADVIQFNIAGGGVHVINPSFVLTITDTVTIDGTLNNGVAANGGGPAIVLDGASLFTNGLTLADGADGSTIRGLVIRNFNGDGILIEQGANGNTIAGNYIGNLREDGTRSGASDQNSGAGIHINSLFNTIGGSAAADRNVISGNNGAGILIENPAGSAVLGINNTIQGNIIGAERDGTTALANSVGIELSDAAQWDRIVNNTIVHNTGSGVVIGGAGTAVHDLLIGDGAGDENTIAFNGGDGVTVLSGTHNAIVRNSIYSNAGLGIDLRNNGAETGVTPNDSGDADSGGNELQNTPLLASAQIVSGTQVRLIGTLSAAASTQHLIEFFSNTTADPSGHGEGQAYLGSVTVTTDGSGNASFDSVQTAILPAGSFITATATNYYTIIIVPVRGSTSEFSNNVVLNNTAPVLDATKSPQFNPIPAGAPAPIGAAGTLVSALVDFASPAGQLDNVTDPDSGALLGIAITAVDSANGTLYYTTNNGGAWTAVGAVSNTNALLLAANGNTRLYYETNVGASSTASVLTIRAWDRSTGSSGSYMDISTNGGATAFSSATDIVALTVSAVNNAPVNTVPGAQSVNEDTPLAIGGISVNDADGNLATTQLTVNNGTLNVTLAGGAVIVAGTNSSADLTLGGTQAQINSALATLTYQGNANFNGSDTLRVLSTDSAPTVLADTDTVAITVNAVNDPPAASGGNVTGTEDTAYVFNWADFNVSDLDTAISGATALRMDVLPASGVLEYLSGSSWTPVALGQLVSKTTIDAGALRFVPTADESGYDGYAAPGIGNLLQDYARFTYTPVQTTAISIVNANGQADTLAEGVFQNPATGWTTSGADAGVQNLTVAQFPADHDNSLYANAGATLTQTLAATFTAARDYSLAFEVGWRGDAGYPTEPGFRVELWAGATLMGSMDQSGVTSVQGKFVSGVLNMTGGSSGAVEGSALQIRLVGTSLQANFDNIVLTSFVPSTDVGAAATMTVDITPVNDAPVLAGASTLAYTENAAASAINTALTVADVDTTLATATVSITANFVAGQDVLGFTNVPASMGNIAGSYNAGTGVMTLASAGNTATLAQWQAALRAVTYANTSDAPAMAARTVSYQVSDGQGVNATSNVRISTVNVTAVNDPPVASDDLTTTPSGTAVTVNVLANDFSVDGGALGVYDVTRPLHGTVTINGDGTLSYAPLAGYTGADSFDYVARDATDGLVHYWRLDGNAQDAVGGATGNGTLQGSPVTTAGQYGDAIQFDGVNDYVTAPDVAYSNQFTLSFWFRIADNAGTGFRYMYSHGAAGTQNSVNVFFIENATVTGTGINDVLRTRVLDSNDVDDVSGLDVAAAPLADNQWHLYTLTANGSSGANVYVDGVLRASNANGGDAINPSGSVNFGANDTLSAARFHNGGLDGVALYDYAVPASAVPALYGGGSALATVNVAITNQSPVATNLSAAETYTEDTPLNLTNIVISDVDSANVTATLTLSNAAAGSLNTGTSGAVTSTYNAGTGVWTASGAISNVNTLLAGLIFTPATDFNASFTIASSVSDGVAAPITGSKAVTGVAVNDAPTATNLSTAETYTEDTALNLSDIVIGDIDSGNVTATLTLSNAAAGSLNTGTSGAVTSTYNAGSGVWTASGAIANVNSLLAGLTFTPAANFNSSFTIATSVSDSVAAPVTGLKSITGVAVNDAPTATNLSAAETYTEDTGLNLVDIVSGDIDSANVTATLTLSNPAAGSLSTATSGAVTSAYVAGTGVWTASGAMADVNTLLAGLAFTPAANFNGSFTIATSLSDGVAAPVSGVKAMTGVAVNDAPAATNLSAAESYTEDTALNLIDMVVSDVDSANVTATLTLSNAGAGTLNTSTSGAVTSTYNAGTGVWSASGAIANVNTLLAGLTFTPTANFNSGFTIATSVSDGVAAPVTGSKAITGVAVNDASTATNLSAAETYTEDTPLNLADIVIADIDSVNVTATLTLSNPGAGRLNTATSGALTSTYNAGTGVWSVSGAIANVNTLLAGLSFTPSANFNGSFTIATSVSDGVAAPLAGNKNVTGIAINDAPVAVNDSLTASEDTPVTYTALQLLGNDSDNDGPALAITNVVSGTGGSAVLNGDGSVTFTPGVNFNGSAGFTYTATDGTLSSNVATVSINVASINDAPLLTVPGAQIVTSNTVLPIAGISATDVDGNLATLKLGVASGTLSVTPAAGALVVGNGGATVTVSGSEAAINTTLATLRYLANTGFSGADTLAISAEDSAGFAASGAVAITVSAVNGVPVIGGVATGSVTEDAAPTLAASGTLTISDPDPGQSRFVPQTNVAGALGTFSISSAGDWTYTAANSQPGVQQLGAGATRSETFTVVSADGSAARDVAITIVGTDDGAVLAANTGARVDEGASLVLTSAMLDGSDIDGGPPPTYRVLTAPGSGVLNLVGNALRDGDTFTQDDINNGRLAYSHNGSETTADAFDFALLDATATAGLRDTFSLAITPLNDPPAAADVRAATPDSASLVFHPGDFGYFDAEGDALARIRITALPATGSLLLGATAIGVNQEIAVADVAAGRLAFAPQPGSTAQVLAVIGFQVSDGQAYSAAHTVAITVAPSQMVAPPQNAPVVTAPAPDSTAPVAPASQTTATPAVQRPASSLPGVPDASPNTTVEAALTPAVAAVSQGAPQSPARAPALDGIERAAHRLSSDSLLPPSFITFAPGVLQAGFTPQNLGTPEASAATRAAAATGSLEFTRGLDRVREGARDAEALEQNILVSTVSASAGLSVGYVLWLLRGSLLLTSVLSSLPAWRFVDPLPVLGRLGDDEDEDTESLESIVSESGASGVRGAA